MTMLPHPPKRRRSTRDMPIHRGITDTVQMWTMPQGALPHHPRYHPTWLFYKRHDDMFAIAEHVVYEIFELVRHDLCPTVYLTGKKGELGSLMRWVTQSVKAASKAYVVYGSLLSKQETRDLAAIEVVDALTCNVDRHGKNMLRYKGRLIPIDHGLAFGEDDYRTDQPRSRFGANVADMATWKRSASAALAAIDRQAPEVVALLNKALAEAEFEQVNCRTILDWTASVRKRMKIRR